jgi:hypothetical protein
MNGVADNLMATWEISLAGIGVLTNAVQLGFVRAPYYLHLVVSRIDLGPAEYLHYVLYWAQSVMHSLHCMQKV